jgi:hypothetical protein
MTQAAPNSRRPVNTRRWPRFHVHLPVSIATGEGGSSITVPGLVSELSQGGMELYGGVQRRPGDLLEVEFRTSESLRVAGIIRNRAGYCFGLEFLSLSKSNLPDAIAPESAAKDAWRLDPGVLGIEARSSDDNPENLPDEAALAELFLVRHDNYLRDRDLIIKRLRQRALEMRRFRQEMEMLLESDSAGH